MSDFFKNCASQYLGGSTPSKVAFGVYIFMFKRGKIEKTSPAQFFLDGRHRAAWGQKAKISLLISVINFTVLAVLAENVGMFKKCVSQYLGSSISPKVAFGVYIFGFKRRKIGKTT